MGKKQSSSLYVVSECCELLSHTADSAKALMQCCRKLTEAFRAHFCVVTSYDTAEQRLAIRASHGLYLEELQDIVPGHSISFEAFRQQHVQNVALPTDLGKSEYETSTKLAKRCHSFLSVPLVAQGHALGALTIGRASRQAFPQNIVNLCNVLATPIASFLQNSELLKQSNATVPREEEEEEKKTIPSQAGQFLSGKSISPGVCMGRCLILACDDALRTAPIVKSANPNAERARLKKAYEVARQVLANTRPEVADVLAEADDSIFDMYEILLDDPTLQERIDQKLTQGYELNSALALTLQEIEADLNHLTDDYLRERIHDIEDVLLRLLNAASNQASSQDFQKGDTPPIVLVARELFPSQLLASPLKHVCGIVCETGGVTSHATILARALHIPMLVGLKDIQKLMRSGDQILVDCGSGLCFPSPSEKLVQQYHLALTAANRKRAQLFRKETVEAPVDDRPCTLDGTPIQLCGNITLFSEMNALHDVGVREIGLYRTEFMFMIRNTMPDEETQYRVITRLVNAAHGAPVAIRALDIGGDKPLPYIKWDEELNPSLGWRGLRFLLSSPELLRTQLRAILRACTAPNVSLTFPMVSDRNDLRRVKEAVAEAKRSLQSDQLPYGNPKLGMMLELPSALVCLESLLPEVDFVSIGTNDLVQYLFAVDRGNSHVTKWFQQHHPVVLQILGKICSTMARYPDKSLQLCGELAGAWLYTPMLLGAGLRRLSMNPSVLPTIRNRIRRLRLSDCEELYKSACECDSADQVYRLATAFIQEQREQ